MNGPVVRNVSRRRFLQVGAGAAGGLVLGFHLPGGLDAWGNRVGADGRLNGYVMIEPDGTITISLTHAEMGQGVHTALPMILAEELEADWSTIRVLLAPAAKEGAVVSAASGTGGSRTIRSQYGVVSKAGAIARDMLRQAAANRWNVPLEDCIARNGAIVAGDRTASYGDLSLGASMLPAPATAAIKTKAEWRLLGKPTKRLDARDKSTGQARFGVDVVLEDMLVGTIQQCPQWGGKLKTVDAAPALTVKGVEHVVTTDAAVMVLGSGYWPASKGLAALTPEWDSSSAKAEDSNVVANGLAKALRGKTAKIVDQGNIAQASKFVSKSITTTYEVPYLHQATMEPMNATAWVRDGKIDVWAPVQSAGRERLRIAQEFGVAEDDVTVHVTFLGGGFGRRSSMDFIRPAIIASQEARRPVKMLWSREEDMSHGLMRPIAKGRFAAGLNVPGMPVTWDATLAVPSISKQQAPHRVTGQVDPVSVYGADNLPYAIPHQRLRYAMPDFGAPLGFWRSVPHSYTAFFVESFLDEIAQESGTDPFVLRERLLVGQGRELALLAKLKQASDWAAKPEKGRFRGMAFHECFGSLIGQVVELSMQEDDDIRLERITAVIDCGMAINPLTIQAQIEGGIIFGLTAAMYGRIDVADGAAVQKNFDTYEMVRMGQVPPVDVHILEGGPIGGIGEPGVPPIAPALTNALFAATGTRYRKLPLMDAGLSLAGRHSD
jgi:isoquinoline 1-oxidoreductase beta subunit